MDSSGLWRTSPGSPSRGSDSPAPWLFPEGCSGIPVAEAMLEVSSVEAAAVSTVVLLCDFSEGRLLL